MAKQNWIKSGEFLKQQGLTTGALAAIRRQSPEAFKPFYVDTLYFERRKLFLEKVQLEAQQLYFLLTYGAGYSIKDLCRILNKMRHASWRRFFEDRLFSLATGNYTLSRVSKMLWTFWRWGRLVFILGAKKKGRKFIGITKAYYKLMEE